MDNVFSDLRLNCSIDARKDWIDQVRLRASEVVAKASLVAVSSDILLQHAYPELKRYLSEPIGRASDSGLSCDDYQPSNALAIGDVVGDNYQIVRWIDDGGTASVYEAIQIGSKRRVAIKLFELRDAADETCAVAEAKLASELRHEHIVTVFSFFKDRHFVGICMELLEHSLLSINRRFSGCYQEIAQLLVQITTAVAYCHSNGIVHRDVGPHNILFLGNSPRIVDFGLAVHVGRSGTVARSSGVGTLGYASPEQVSGLEVDHRTDVYALGAVLYHLLTGICRFRAITWDTASLVLGNLDPTPPCLFDQKVPSDLNAICLRCLQIKPEHRFEDAVQLADELDSFLRKHMDRD